METTNWRAEDHPFYVDEANPHLGGYRKGGDIGTYYPDLWRWLVEEYHVKSVIDVGCGDGVAIKFLEQYIKPTAAVIGIDGVKQDSEFIFQHDFTKGVFSPEFTLPFNVDLVWCCEFVEHIEEQFLPNVLDVFKSAKTILMTHAMPGQNGHHHVLCRTPAYWIGVFAAIGFRLDEALTSKTRELASLNKSPFNHYLRSGMAFIRYA